MKVIIELDLTNEDDLYEYDLIKKAKGMLSVLADIKTVLRDVLKHGRNEEYNLTSTSTIEDFDDCFHKLLNEQFESDIYDLL